MTRYIVCVLPVLLLNTLCPKQMPENGTFDILVPKEVRILERKKAGGRILEKDDH